MSESGTPPTTTPAEQTPPPSTNTTSTSNNNSNGNDSQSRSASSRNNRNRSTTYVSNHPRDWKGEEHDIGVVLGIKPEKLTNQTTVDGILEKLEGYIKKHLDNYEDVVCLIRDEIDPKPELTKVRDELVTEEQMKKIEDGNVFEIALMNDAVKRYGQRQANLTKNIGKIFELLWGQCTTSVRTLLKGNDEYESKRKESDVLWLIPKLRQLTSGVDEEADAVDVYFNALFEWTHIRQYDTENEDAFKKRIDTVTQNLILAGGEDVLYPRKLLESQVVDKDKPPEKEKKSLMDRIRAMHLLCRSDIRKHGGLVSDLRKAKDVGRDEWPKKQTAAFKLLVKRANSIPNRNNPSSHNNRNRFQRGVQFVQQNNNNNNQPPVPGTNDRCYPDSLCYNCQRKGHIATYCPQRQNGMYQYNFSQTVLALINKWWILIDTCSTCNVTNNKQLLTSTYPCSPQETLQIVTNGGGMKFTEMGQLKLLPLNIHYNADSIATILSFHVLAKLPGIHLQYDNLVDDKIYMTLPNKQRLVFAPCDRGLYFLDSSKLNSQPFTTNTDYNLITTVQKNKEFWTQKEIQGAENARSLQEHLSWPGTTTLKHYITNNLINNTTVTTEDIDRATVIFGPPEPLCKGKMTRQRPHPHLIPRIPIPPAISKHHMNVQLYVDFLFVNKMSFLTTVSDNLKYRTIKYAKSMTKSNIQSLLTQVIVKYTARGFNVTTIHADNQFNIPTLRDNLLPTHLEIYATNEHVAPIERQVRTTKERTRCTCHAAPYRKYPKLMIINLLENVTNNLNDFPSKDSVSSTTSPATIVEGVEKPNMNHKRIAFGSYALVWVRTTNSMKRRAIPAIALQPSNRHGGYYFMSLNSGKRINSYNWNQLPIPDDVIQRVEQLANDENQPYLDDKTPMFEWAPGIPVTFETANNTNTEIEHHNEQQPPEEAEEQLLHPINNDNNEEIINFENQQAPILQEEEEESLIDDNDIFDGAIISDDDEHLSIASNQSEPIFNEEDHFITDDEDLSYDSTDNEDILSSTDSHNGDVNSHVDSSTTSTSDANIPQSNSFVSDNDSSNEGATSSPPTIRRTQRENAGAGISRINMNFHGKSYDQQHTTINHHQFITMKQQALNYIVTKEKEQKEQHLHHTTLLQQAVKIIFNMHETNPDVPKPSPQMSASRGIIKYGELAVAAIMKEFKQLVHGAFPGKPVVEAIKASELSEEDKKTALDAVNLIKVKKDGTVKGRTCANGSKERFYLTPEESVASPTASIESIISTLLVDVYEERDIAIFDIPGAYLHAEMPEKHRVMLKIKGHFVDIMCRVNPDFEKHVILEHGKRVLYLKILRALYGCIRSALLWYNLYIETLKNDGYKINPYDRCVANKTIEGKQCTLVWYVDDNKISHADKNIVSAEMKKISNHFGDLSIQRGDSFDFLGMKIDIDRNKKNVHISMIDDVQGAIDMFEDDLRSDINSPAYKDLFETYDDKAEDLDKGRSETFHRVVAKLLFITKRARPDIETAMSYLTTRVSKSNIRDWYKLKRLLSFLKKTIKDERIIGASSLNDLFTWVDASYAVHPNMRGHTGGTMSYGTGVIHAKSNKQKLNVKSSTECEIVATSEYCPFNIWIMMFMEAQGYPLKNNILLQDNQSAIRIEKNGRNSCTGNSRHVNIRYFFVKDRVDKGEISVKYCPTHLMLADFFTKPLNGKLFHLFRDVIMGYKDIHTLSDNSFSLKERIGNVSKKENEFKNNTENKGDEQEQKLTYAEVVRSKRNDKISMKEEKQTHALNNINPV